MNVFLDNKKELEEAATELDKVEEGEPQASQTY